ncbi:MAG: cytochrome P450, partial [Pseudonocardiaceae bacterium]
MTASLHTIPPTIEDGGRTLLPWLREMRDEHPVWRDAYGIWHVFRYADVARAISDPQVFSSDTARVFPVGQKFTKGNLLRTDPPRHHTLRRLVGAAFSPKVVTGLAPRIAEVSHELLDATGGAAEFDLVSALAYPLPVTVIAELLGLPTSDRELFRSWADKLFDRDMADPSDPELARKIDDATADMLAYLGEHCADRRAHPRQDLISRLATVEADGERLSDEEVVNFSVVLLIAGHITTTALLGNTVLCVDEHPDVWAQLRADRPLVEAAVEEVLRYRSSFTQV